MSILLFINLKGGVAKTTNAVAVAECLAESGHRVLVIDADHQCMAGELLLGESRLLHCERRKATLHDLLAEMLDDDFEARQLPGYVAEKASDIADGLASLSVIPCSIRIDDFSTNMAKARRGYHTAEEFQAALRPRREAMRRWLRTNYHFTIIDCPPSIPIHVRMLINMADTFVLPTIPDRLSVRGALWLLDRIRRLGVKMTGLGTLWSLYREQNKIHRKIIDAVDRRLEPYQLVPCPFEAVIPNATPIAAVAEPEAAPAEFWRSTCRRSRGSIAR